jgi:peptide/nickel transport system substrate-binding protein
VRAPGWIQSIQQRDPNMQFDLTVPGSFNTLHINLTQAPFDNLLVRQALAHALDREAISAALAPMAAVVYSLNPPTFPTGFTLEDLPADLRYEYDPAKSKALLAEAGHPDGIEFSANCSQREDYSSIMLIVQEQFRAAGINMNLNIMDHTAYHADNRKDLNTLALNSSSYPPIPMRIYLDYLASSAEVKPDSSGGVNYSHYGVAMPGVDELIQQALAATSYDQHIEIGRQIELQVQRDLPALALPTLSYVIARNARIDLGYEVKSGFARWRLHRATIVA